MTCITQKGLYSDSSMQLLFIILQFLLWQVALLGLL